jgi:Fe2+ or Zn2+ uptake regulation protein
MHAAYVAEVLIGWAGVGGDTDPLVDEIAAATKQSCRSVYRALRELEAADIIARVERPGKSNLYYCLHWDRWAVPVCSELVDEGR